MSANPQGEKPVLHEPGRVRKVGHVRFFKAPENAEGTQHAHVILMPGVEPGRRFVPGNWNLDPSQMLGRARGVWHVNELRGGVRLPKGGFFVKEPQPRGERDNRHETFGLFEPRAAAKNALWEARLLIGVRNAFRGLPVRVEKPLAYVQHQYGQARLVTRGFDGIKPLLATPETVQRVMRLKETARQKGFLLRDLLFVHSVGPDALQKFLNVFQDRKGRLCIVDAGYWQLAANHPDYARFGRHYARVRGWPSGEWSW